MPPPKMTWAFDLGLGSIGEVVRSGSSFLHAESWLIPETTAQRGPATASGTPASRYRALKTREAHRAREERLRTICAEAGIEVLNAKRVERDPLTKKYVVIQEADCRLTREFPRTGDNTCYTSCLLRIMLLQGQKTAPWQVFKALHSAIQRRGFDSKVAWKTRTGDDESESETKIKADAYIIALHQMAPDAPEFHFPCYLEAYRLGLWSPQKPNELQLRIDHRAEPARNRGIEGSTIIAPRELVIAETRRLLEAAATHFPKLQGRIEEVLFGQGRVPYASFYPDIRKAHNLRRGGSNDWDGILGQKVPRFDNRIIAKCALIPRLNACKAEPRKIEPEGPFAPDSILASEVIFLLKLKNVRIQRGTGIVDGLNIQELNQLYEERHLKGPTKYSFSEQEWKKALKRLGLEPAPGHAEIAPPRNSGRSRFCRPALRILKDLVLSGRAPYDQHSIELQKIAGNNDERRGLVARDLDFLKRMGDSWTTLYIPDQQYDQLLRIRDTEGREAAINALVSSTNNPRVRHRLGILWDRVKALEERFGEPSDIVLEFVRQDFMGEDAKKQLQKFQNDRTKARKAARERAKDLRTESRSAALKYELLEAQGFRCLYTGENLAQTAIDSLEIEHIVPRALGGPDAMVNYVVTSHATNTAKGDRTPYQWFEANQFPGWDAYVARVKERETFLRSKKVRLLTLPEAPELVQRYTALAETAYIARLAQTLVALNFNWPIRSEKGQRRITIVNGGLTSRVRRNYRLNSLLSPCPAEEDQREWEEKCEKNRKDKRHHAIDAMVISFIPNWARDPGKEGFFRLPENVTKETFAAALEKVLPKELISAKPALEATIYGERTLEGKRYGISRIKLSDFAVKHDKNKRILKPAKDIKPHQLFDPVIRRDIEQFIASCPNLTIEEWDEWASQYRRGGPDGPRVKKITITVTNPDALEEYRDLSKDGSRQLRRGSQHRGYFVVDIPAPSKKNPEHRKFEVRPVYAHESKTRVEEALNKEAGLKIVGYFVSGCTVQIFSPIEHPKTPLKPGLYRLNSIWEQGNAVVRSSSSQDSAPISLTKLIAAGLKRVELNGAQ